MILSLPFSLPDATPIGDRYAMDPRWLHLLLLQSPTLRLPSRRRPPRHAAAARRFRCPPSRHHGRLLPLPPHRRSVVKRYREHGEDAFLRRSWTYRRRPPDGRRGGQAARFRDERQRLRPASASRPPSTRTGVPASSPTPHGCPPPARTLHGCGHRSPRQRRRSADRPGCGHRSRHSRRPRPARSLGPRGSRRRTPHACQRRPGPRPRRGSPKLTPSLTAASSRRCRCCCARACSAPPTACSACPPDSTA